MPDSGHLAGGHAFESAALYDLVAGLRVHAYDDLLSPHWSVPDGPVARERLDAERFVRHDSPNLSHVIVSLPASSRSDGGEELGTATRATALIVLGDICDRAIPAERVRTIVPVPDRGSGRLPLGRRLRQALAGWWRRITVLLGRGR
jgi:hypothetical protein